MLDDLGDRKGSMLIEDPCDGPADGLRRRVAAACLRPDSERRSNDYLWPRLLSWLSPRRNTCLWLRTLIESLDFALGHPKIRDLRFQFSDLRVDAFDWSVHDAFAYEECGDGKD